LVVVLPAGAGQSAATLLKRSSRGNQPSASAAFPATAAPRHANTRTVTI